MLGYRFIRQFSFNTFFDRSFRFVGLLPWQKQDLPAVFPVPVLFCDGKPEYMPQNLLTFFCTYLTEFVSKCSFILVAFGRFVDF